MRRHGFWIEIVLLAASIACGVALLLATLGAAAGSVGGSNEPQEVTSTSADQVHDGMVTCSRCGAKHSTSLARTADTCVRVCVHGGASFALVNADSTYLLEGDLTELKKLAGQRARVIGPLNGNTIKVISAIAGT
jgi:hypothetical protein